MSCLPKIFEGFEPQIREQYIAASADAGVDLESIHLELAEKSWYGSQYKSEFAAIDNPPQVRITWNGIASLWACAHAIGRISRRMFEAQRKLDAQKHDVRLFLASDSELEKGLFIFELSLRVAKNKWLKWVDWVPTPTPTPKSDDDKIGNTLFLGALGWIMRHELAHHVLKHHETNSPLPASNINQELQADAQASDWIKKHYKPDEDRVLGAQPSEGELQLEKRALATFVGLVWLIQFECVPHGVSATHPKGSERLKALFDRFGLANDSLAA
jgi:hypothetical protein